jgi:murein DD-endopeptidase MepM/ murein hydrolase activator NlpD
VVTNTPARQTQNYVDQTQYRSPNAATPPPNVVIRDRASEQAKPTLTRPGVPPKVAIPSPLNQPPRPLARRGVPPLSPRSGQSQPGIRRVVPESLSLPKLINNALKRPAPYPNNGNRGLLFPLGIPADISSVFGWRVHPIHGDWRMHTGTDLAAPQGTPVLAAYHGEVAIADYVGGYGNMVVLRHEDGTQESRYAHLSHIFVRPGEWVEQGDVIGLVGSTGNSTGPHLHFEWRHWYANNWVPVDAGAQLAWALAEMRQTMHATMTPEERSQVELGQMAWNSATLFLSSEGETAEVPAETAGAIAPSATELGNKAAESLTNERSLKPQALYYIEQDAPDQPLRVKPSPALTNPAIQP